MWEYKCADTLNEILQMIMKDWKEFTHSMGKSVDEIILELIKIKTQQLIALNLELSISNFKWITLTLTILYKE